MKINEYEAECNLLVSRFFSESEYLQQPKTNKWFASPNCLLGGHSPDYMLVNGKGKKLLAFIKTRLEENGGR